LILAMTTPTTPAPTASTGPPRTKNLGLSAPVVVGQTVLLGSPARLTAASPCLPNIGITASASVVLGTPRRTAPPRPSEPDAPAGPQVSVGERRAPHRAAPAHFGVTVGFNRRRHFDGWARRRTASPIAW